MSFASYLNKERSILGGTIGKNLENLLSKEHQFDLFSVAPSPKPDLASVYRTQNAGRFARTQGAGMTAVGVGEERTFMHTVGGVKQTGGPASMMSEPMTQMELPGMPGPSMPISARPPENVQGEFSPYKPGGPFTKSAAEGSKAPSKRGGYSWLANEGEGPNWLKPLKGMANGLFNNLTSGHLIRPAIGAMAGAVGGAVTGLVGQEVLPNNMQYDGFVQPMFKGALVGAALGIAGPAASGLTKVLNRPEMGNYSMLKGPASMVTKMSHSGLYKGATAIAAGGIGFSGAFSTNMTNPINRIDRA